MRDMIVSFGDHATARLWSERRGKYPPDILRRAMIKLMLLHRAKTLQDLRVPPGNRLEPLSGDRDGQYSIRINGQWRVCFVWKDGNAHHVEIVDYH